jgi:hypothetical protein
MQALPFPLPLHGFVRLFPGRFGFVASAWGEVGSRFHGKLG